VFGPEKYKIGTSEENQSTSTFCAEKRQRKNSNSETPWMSCERESEKTTTSTSVGGINDLNCCEYWISFQISANTPTPQYIRFCFFLLNGFDCVTIFMELLSIKKISRFFFNSFKWNYSNHILETFSCFLARLTINRFNLMLSMILGL
jgi:hypothetical protein